MKRTALVLVVLATIGYISFKPVTMIQVPGSKAAIVIGPNADIEK